MPDAENAYGFARQARFEHDGKNKVVTFVTFCFAIIIAIRSRGNF